MQLDQAQIAAALDVIAEDLGKAHSDFNKYYDTDDPWAEGNAEWQLEMAYTGLLVLAEALEMPLLHAEIRNVWREACEKGILTSTTTPDGDPYLTYGGPAHRFVSALRTSLTIESASTVTKDLESILKSFCLFHH